jgi:hypothetical protein
MEYPLLRTLHYRILVYSITDATIEPYFARQRFRQANYRSRFQNDIEDLRNLVSNALNNDRS